MLGCQAGRDYTAIAGSANFSYDGMDVNHELDVALSGSDARQIFMCAKEQYVKDA
jgi:phosphatidylserine/phosphatidylglycerophosphate/cardiolipin synthase-like enzyme